MLLFIKALLIFLLIKHHYTTPSSNLMEHTWTNNREQQRRGEGEREQRDAGRKSASIVSGSGLTGGGTKPLGGSVALHGTAWHYASLRWTYKCKGGEERSETYVGVLSEILSPNDAEAAGERLIMAVRDVTDKIYPEKRVELQG